MRITNIVHKMRLPTNNNIMIFGPGEKCLIVKNPYKFPSLSWYDSFIFKSEWHIFLDGNKLL